MAWASGWFVKSRVYLCTAIGCFVAGQSCAQHRASADGLQGLSDLLGSAAGAQVDIRGIAWEPSGGALLDTLWGRQVLFLARPRGESANDLFRARVRVSLEGKPAAVHAVKNLTQTELGHETALQVKQDSAVFASLAFGELQGITLLGLRGVATEEQHGSWFNRQLLRLRAWQRTGSLAGVGRAHIGLVGANSVRLDLKPPLLQISAGEDRYSVDLRRKSFLEPGGGADSSVLSRHSADDRAVLTTQHQGADQWLHTLVDLVREEVGPRSVAWLEDSVFAAQDGVRRGAHHWFGESRRANPSPTSAMPDSAAVPPLTWPPPDVPSIWQEPVKQNAEDGSAFLEGRWRPAGHGVEKAEQSDLSAPLFLETAIYPDRERPYAKLSIIALDMRRLELRMQAGFEEPKPKTGPPGRGALPDDPATLQRVVATFNGAFKSLHGDYGMMVERRILVPPKPRAASIVVTEDTRVGLGDWSDESRVDEQVVSFRQNLDALVSDGAVNPKQRRYWGENLIGHSTLTERSALCLSQQGNLYYAFGADLTALSLAHGMQQAGCRYALHLDMNPGHTGFFFVDASGGNKEHLTSKPAFEGMSVHPKKYALWSEKDFFYVLEREATPSLGGLTWQASVGTQPEPHSSPGLFTATMNLGTLSVQIFGADAGRLNYRLTGGGEPIIEGRPSPKRQLQESEAGQVLFALSLGHTTLPTRYGLSFGKRSTLPLRQKYGTLVLDSAGDIELLPAGQRVVPEDGHEYVQLPELMKMGQVTEHAGQRGARRPRGAICILDSGRVLVSLAEHDSSDALALALRQLGCANVLELDRGSKHPAQLLRAGTANTVPRDDVTTLFGLNRPMQPWTFRLNPNSVSERSRP